MADVVLQDVSKTFPGGVHAVVGASLHVGDGQFVVLVGPSGCGKSTTLRMVAGLEEITSGTIRIGDRVVNNVPPKDRDIAMVFQNYALYPHMTAYKNMGFALKLRGAPRKEIDARVRQAADLLGIADLLDRKPKALSGGQRQRVAVGRAIVRQPKVFLFDEPLSNLDAKLRVEMRAELKRLHARLGTTTIYVTHDQEEAMTLGQRIVVMHEGRIQQCDGPLEVYNRPVNRFVAGFVGTPPMNFFKGRIERRGEGMAFVAGAAELEVPPARAGALAAQAGRPIVLGLRPEGISLSPAESRAAGAAPVPARLIVVEPLGERMDLRATADGLGEFVARVEARPGLGPDQTLTLHFDMNRAHFFGEELDAPRLG